MRARTVWKILALFALINALLLGWGWARRWQPGALRVTFLDVGQGDAAVMVVTVSTPSDAGRRMMR
jgi:beta-lactamase superfamily II metal-dependent hydrolase